MTAAETLDGMNIIAVEKYTGGEVRDGADAECHIEYDAGNDQRQG